MCSYGALKPRTPEARHLMHARWTPQAASTISVTLAGKTPRCAPLREPVDSLP
jgi:hypothetical protein